MTALVFDRTQADVQEARALRASGLDLAARLKGCYDHIDRNRVGQAVNAVAAWLNANGYHSAAAGVTGWTQASLPDAKQNAAMLAAVTAVRDDFTVFAGTPALPVTLHGMDYADANALERVLHDLFVMAEWAERCRVVYFSDDTFYE